MFEDSDKNVRKAATELAVEMYRWLKDKVRNVLQELRSAQSKELESLFEKADKEEERKPNRKLQSNVEEMEVEEDVKTEETKTEETNGLNFVYYEILTFIEELEPEDNSEPVEIQLPPNFEEDVVCNINFNLIL